MGGQKKLSLKQIERAQARRQEADKDKKKKEKKGVPKEKKNVGILPPSVKNKKNVNDIKKMKELFRPTWEDWAKEMESKGYPGGEILKKAENLMNAFKNG